MTARATKVGKRAAKGAAVRKKTFPRNERATSRPANAKTRKLAPLGKLRADESTRVLLSLIRRHPELRREADELALALIETVDAKKVGTELGQRLVELDIFDTSDNSRQDGGYVPIWDAVAQTPDELLEPYLVDLRRQIELGLKEAAQSTCLGIVLGLYLARECPSGDSLLAHAPDFCEGEAHYVVDLLAKQSGQLHRRRWPLPDGSQVLLADWSWLLPRRAKRKKQR